MSSASTILDLLVCPRDKAPLRTETTDLVCEHGHSYPIIEGVPILLVSEMEQTHIEGSRSLQVAQSRDVDSLPRFDIGMDQIDPFVRNAIGATNGGMYEHLVGRLKEYPIPNLRLASGEGRLFMEVGCNWGRWCIAAARQGYRPVGIDPSLKAIRAANRVATQLGIEATYLVADARSLPFRDEAFEQIFSYSVLQHLSKENVKASLPEIRRTMKVGGNSLIQLPNTFGVRCLYHEMRRGFREAQDFEVRYWRPSELRAVFSSAIGPSVVSVDGFFSLNVQPSDLHLLPFRYRTLVQTSEILRKVSGRIPLLTNVADSLYISSDRVS